MSSPLIERIWSNLSEEQKASLGPSISFICIGSTSHGKSTFIEKLGVTQKQESPELTLWETKCGQTELKFHEYSSLATLPTKDSLSPPLCILFFSKFPQELTGDFRLATTRANTLAKSLQCPIVLVHTFCSQIHYPNSFVAAIQKKNASNSSDEVIFREWRKQKEEVVANIFGFHPLSISCAYSFLSKDILPDGTSMEKGIEDQFTKLLLILCGAEKYPSLDSHKVPAATLNTRTKFNILKALVKALPVGIAGLVVLVGIYVLIKKRLSK